MKYFKKNIPSKWQVFAYEDDGSQDSLIEKEMISITEIEALEIANSEPVDKVALDVIRNASSVRNWTWPPKSYQEAIGQITVSSSSVEVLIRTVIWHVSGLDSSAGRAFTGKMRIDQLVEVLKALIEYKSPHLNNSIASIGSMIKTAFAKRSVYVHQVWTVKDGLPAVGKLFLERYERLESTQTVTLEDMYSLSDEMNKIQNKLMSEILTPLLNNSR